MAIADLNMVFGKNEEPLISRMDDIVLPALKAGIIRIASENVKFLFENCEIVDFNGEWVVKGVLIKDMIVDVMSEYTETGLRKTDKHFPSSPYSVFILFLKNHRIMLVKNQSGSPDIRSFKTSFKYTIKEYIKRENEKRKKNKEKLLPHARINITGVKTSKSVKESLKDVEKITELTFQFFPLNAEWDYDPIFGNIDQAIRKVIIAKGGKMVFPSPESIDGVAKVIEKTGGLVKAKMKVRYKDNTEKGKSQKTGIIKDNEISDISNIEITGELDESFDQVYNYKDGFSSLNVVSKNNLKLYNAYIEGKKNGDK